MGKILFILILSFPVYSQNIQGVRYQIKTDTLDSLVAKSCQKKFETQNYKAKIPKYLDYILLKNHLIEVFWNSDSTFSGLRIYPFLEQNVYLIGSDFKISKQTNAFIKDVSFQQLKDTIVSQRELKAVQYTARNMFQMTYYYKTDSLKIELPEGAENSNVELSFYFDNLVFPIQIVVGAPKSLMALIAVSELNIDAKIDLYSELLLSYHAIRRRKKELRQLEM
ncbi:MAG: hypothetical protein AB8B72_06955 [Crocinitomicaceae bacterium]